MILKVQYFYKEQSVFMSRLHKMVLASWSMFQIGKFQIVWCTFTSPLLKSVLPFTVDWKFHRTAMVLPLGFTIMNKARNYTYAHT